MKESERVENYTGAKEEPRERDARLSRLRMAGLQQEKARLEAEIAAITRAMARLEARAVSLANLPTTSPQQSETLRD